MGDVLVLWRTAELIACVPLAVTALRELRIHTHVLTLCSDALSMARAF